LTLTNWKVIVPVPPKDSVLNTNVHENRVLLTIVLRRVPGISEPNVPLKNTGESGKWTHFDLCYGKIHYML
jgi:hypothetical protein